MSDSLYVKQVSDLEDYYFDNYIKNHIFFLNNKELENAKKETLLLELAYFYNSSFDFIVQFIQNQMERDAATFVSDQWVNRLNICNPEEVRKSVSRLINKEFDFDTYIPKLSMQAICNHMLFLSVKDPYSFVACWNFVFNKAWNINQMNSSRIDGYSIALGIFDAIKSEGSLVHLIQMNAEQIPYQTFRAQKSIRLLAETFSLFYHDILLHNNEYIKSQNEKFQLYFNA